MPSITASARLKMDFRRLRRSMDFASTHRSLSSPHSKLGRHLAEIYQQLGHVWEFLALQCRHEEGSRTTRTGIPVCRICGTVEGTCEQWRLLPRSKRKSDGDTSRNVKRPSPAVLTLASGRAPGARPK